MCKINNVLNIFGGIDDDLKREPSVILVANKMQEAIIFCKI